jgi:membrane protease YdiL (CAAX protease family)
VKDSPPRAPVPTAALGLALAIAHFAAVTLLLDARHAPKLGWVEPGWMLLEFFALPLAGIALIDGRRRRLGIALAMLAITVSVTTAYYRDFTGAGRTWALDRPILLFGPAILATALAMAAVLVERPPLEKWGFGLGDWRWWAPRTFGLLGVIVPFVILAGLLFPSLLAFYPDEPEAKKSFLGLVHVQAGRGVYMLTWEFFFRGFLTFGMARAAGDGAGLIVPAFPFFLLHKTKPEPEMASSFVGGIGLSWFCLRAGSFWPAVILHWGLNAVMEIVGFFF